ncbi:geranylgeranyl pyrophosphate synthase, chloroplastic-like [Olea europaea var. sylvestris]|uniref:geranylgeranyl pyrophosphate synthase, chloroplastic-like n=1 Tax=Olea europaea var. sylvestris TaxID=158386 RepID=UPI000C1D4585|nr:geranylgeranyl pyrophosphate synthase, chloroplastic-like [Olea europaea var. sylvestris]
MAYVLIYGIGRLRDPTGGRNSMPSACALEMVHAACLMHDYLSCTDSDDLRRWKPSNHKLRVHAFEHIVTTIVGVKLEKILRVIGELARLIGLEGLVVGQVDDLESGGQDQSDMGFEKLEYIHFHKTTAALEASAIAGAMLEKKSVAITCMTVVGILMTVNSASDEEIERLSKFIENVKGSGHVMVPRKEFTDVPKSPKTSPCAFSPRKVCIWIGMEGSMPHIHCEPHI